jgi:hypothetical protein
VASQICTGIYYRFAKLPRRIRIADCTAFEDAERWVNFNLSLDLTPNPGDNDIASASGAWSLGDLPVTVATQDVDDRGNDECLVGIADRLYLLDYNRFYDEFTHDAHTPIYRRLVLGPLPSGAGDADSPGGYDPFLVKQFRRFTFELKNVPAADNAKYRLSVEEFDRAETRRLSVRELRKRADARISTRGLAFLVTLEHQAEENFEPLWWRAEWDVRGPRIQPNAHTDTSQI